MLRHLPILRTLIALALMTASCAQLRDLPELDERDLKAKLAQSSTIFAGDGRPITTLHGEENRRILRSLQAIPHDVRDAVVAIEDERFYDHDGVDMQAIVRAAIANVTSGGIREGGSTITQQYVKNVLIAPGQTAARTFERKIDEAALARQLERRLTKDQILLRYLNTVYFGNGAYGVQAAAKTYFNKHVKRLQLAEAALLAGLIRAPENYDPYEDVDAARIRRNLVLEKMQELGLADAGEVAAAKLKPLKLDRGLATDRYPAPYFVDYVHRLIKYDPNDEFGKLGRTARQREQALFQGGLRIHTTVDLDMQAAAENAIEQYLPNDSDPHASVVAIDPNNGDVKAMVGGRDWFVARRKDRFAKLNLAIQGEPGLGAAGDGGAAAGTGRQAGSAFKPFALAAAVREGIPLSKTYKAQSCMTFPGANSGKDWRVCNYEDANYGSQLSLFEATAKSVNVVYAQLILEVGAEKVVALADEMGINTPLAPVPSAALGTNPVNPLGMASAYGTFATNGVHHAPRAVTRIVGPTGRVLYEASERSQEALDPASAYITTTALEQVIERGTGVRAQIGRPAAGKTGTAQEYRDAWFAGYTPDLVAAVWVGYPQGEIEMKSSCSASSQSSPGGPSCIPTRITVSGGTWPAEIWAAFMREALAGVPPSDFVEPDIELVEVTIDARTGCLADRFTPREDRVKALLPEGAEPKKSCRVKDEQVKVPDVFGFPVKDALRILEGEGFAVSVTREPTREYPPGRVIEQEPSGGSKVRLGSVVHLVVSALAEGGASPSPKSGGSEREDRQQTTVPDVLGMHVETASDVLHDHGFDVDVIYERESGGRGRGRRDRVWKQSPPGGTEAERGSTVTIWVNP